jgi:hypothetical protein
LGIVPAQIHFLDSVTEQNPFTGVREKYDTAEILIDLSDKGQIASILRASTDGPGYYMVSGTDMRVWTVKEADWDRTFLGALGVEGLHSYEIDSGVDLAKSIAKISAARKLDYSNLSAYWTILDQQDLSNDPKGWVWQAKMMPKIWGVSDPIDAAPLARDADRFGPNGRYLSESDYVHYKIPQLQPLLEKLKPFRAGNRMQMAEHVLQVVNETIKYDMNSLQQNAMYPLTTEDILARRNGICQHFAILFASLARAMGLPTKLIVGYLMGSNGRFGGHAWNEIEVSPGAWRPIEPQGSLSFDSYQYIPIAEAYILEHKEAVSKEWLDAAKAFTMTQFDLHFQAGN